MQSAAATTLAGQLSRELASMRRDTTADCLAVDETVAAILRTLAEGMDDCESQSAVLDCATRIDSEIEQTEQTAITNEHMRKYVAAYVRRVA